MKLKGNCKLDSKVQKTISPLLKLKNIRGEGSSSVTDQIDNEISSFLEKASLLSKEINLEKSAKESEPKGLSVENNDIEFNKMLTDREIKNKRSTGDWYKKFTDSFEIYKNQKSQNKKTGGGFAIIK